MNRAVHKCQHLPTMVPVQDLALGGQKQAQGWHLLQGLAA